MYGVVYKQFHRFFGCAKINLKIWILHHFVPKIQDMVVNSMWFHRDSAAWYTTLETFQLFHKSFLSRVISHIDCFESELAA